MTIQHLAAAAILGLAVFSHQVLAGEVIRPLDGAAYSVVPQSTVLPQNQALPAPKDERVESVQNDPCGFRRPGPYREECRSFHPNVWGKRDAKQN